jgi:uncharacterized protein (DUF2225 family)
MVKQQDSPIFISKLECPICGEVNEVETIKVGAYKEEGRDTDFCPKRRTWNNPDYQKYNPLLFFMTACPNCFFTKEFTSKYKDWKNDTVFRNYKLKTLKEKHLLELKEENGVIRTLGLRLDADRYPFQTAVNKLLLGIYDELFNLQISNLDIGRYYLRIAWLFRENSDSDKSGEGQLASHAMRVEDLIHRLAGYYEQLKEEYSGLSNMTVDFLKDPLFPEGDKKKQLTACYSDSLSDLETVMEKFKSAVVNLKGSIPLSNEIMSDNSSSAAPPDQQYFQWNTYREYLRELKKSWPGVPASEHEALSLAADYYRTAYEEGKEISAGNQAIQAVYLIAELSRRVAKYKEAKGYFNTSIKLAQEYIHANKGDKSRTALARKVLELALEQGKSNLKAFEKKSHEPA